MPASYQTDQLIYALRMVCKKRSNLCRSAVFRSAFVDVRSLQGAALP